MDELAQFLHLPLAVSDGEEFNISEVGRRTGMHYTSVERHLEALSGMGLLREKRYGKIRTFEALFRSVTVRFERSRGVRVETDVERPRIG